MKTRVTRLLVAVLLPSLMGCASTGRPTAGARLAPEMFGSFECVDRAAKASPPPREVLDLGQVRGDSRKVIGRKGEPLLDFQMCGQGRVPVSRTQARATVAKGNPLIGPVDLPLSDFFENREIGARIRQNLLPFEKVYSIPPGLDEQPHQGRPPAHPGCKGTKSFGSCYYYGPAAFESTADGGGMTMRIERPAFGGVGHSLDEISVQGGKGGGNIVEIGWNVSTTQYPDADPHLFVFHWIDWNPTCYDGCGWQQYSGTYFPSMNLGPLVGRNVYIGYVYWEGNWWAWFDDQWIGYFPGSEWGGAFTQSSLIQWFGEVVTDNGIPPRIQMGNGLFPADANAAPNVTLCDVDAAARVCWIRDKQSLGPNYPPYYDIRRTGFGQTRYGGPGF